MESVDGYEYLTVTLDKCNVGRIRSSTISSILGAGFSNHGHR